MMSSESVKPAQSRHWRLLQPGYGREVPFGSLLQAGMLAVVRPLGHESVFSEGPGLPDIPMAAAMETSQRPGSTEVQPDSTDRKALVLFQ